MKKKLNGKLALNRETLRTLEDRQVTMAAGGVTAFCTTGASNVTDTCESCVQACQASRRTC